MAETEKKAKAPAKPRKTTAKSAPKTNEAVVQAHAPAPSHDQIRQLAHKYWAERGHQNGHPELDWLRAEQELRGKAS
ncbi:MAG TPA: DUF2934 domain-containing protein [Acidobacteriaceae bacterium]|nr:DUF2934 domain-containing protein [Acidobacteriaceae bacterium]